MESAVIVDAVRLDFGNSFLAGQPQIQARLFDYAAARHRVTAPPTTQQYYDRFAETYENERHGGYHRLIDELELDLVRRYGAGKDVFEAGCGTGLLLSSHPAVQEAETSVAVGLERTHAQCVGQSKGLLVVGFGYRVLRRLAPHGNLAEEA